MLRVFGFLLRESFLQELALQKLDIRNLELGISESKIFCFFC
jgi:hypothetical protein